VTTVVSIRHRRVRLGSEVRDYELRRSIRRTLAITVAPGGELVVTAPEKASDAQVEAVLRRRRNWISRRTREVIALPPTPSPREWVSGETHRYLGRQYRLKVIGGETPEVRLSGQFFWVTVPEPKDAEQVRQAMERWYLDHARETFARRMQALIGKTRRLALSEPPPLIVRRLQKRWGSCSPEGRILMNVEAVRLPMPCIDYLLVHELCHLRQPNHGPAFWRLLGACTPDWERWRARLARAEI
jgi:predicted metal-dependent hydrolase